MFTLSYREQDGVLRTHSLPPGDTIVGRAATCDVVINHPSVSRLHLKVTVRGDSCVLTDLGSARGTRRQDQLIAGEVELAGGAAAATRSTSSRSTRRLARGRSSL